MAHPWNWPLPQEESFLFPDSLTAFVCLNHENPEEPSQRQGSCWRGLMQTQVSPAFQMWSVHLDCWSHPVYGMLLRPSNMGHWLWVSINDLGESVYAPSAPTTLHVHLLLLQHAHTVVFFMKMTYSLRTVHTPSFSLSSPPSTFFLFNFPHVINSLYWQIQEVMEIISSTAV